MHQPTHRKNPKMSLVMLFRPTCTVSPPTLNIFSCLFPLNWHDSILCISAYIIPSIQLFFCPLCYYSLCLIFLEKRIHPSVSPEEYSFLGILCFFEVFPAQTAHRSIRLSGHWLEMQNPRSTANLLGPLQGVLWMWGFERHCARSELLLAQHR